MQTWHRVGLPVARDLAPLHTACARGEEFLSTLYLSLANWLAAGLTCLAHLLSVDRFHLLSPSFVPGPRESIYPHEFLQARPHSRGQKVVISWPVLTAAEGRGEVSGAPHLRVLQQLPTPHTQDYICILTQDRLLVFFISGVCTVYFLLRLC